MTLDLLYDSISFVISYFFSAFVPAVVVYASIILFRRIADV